MCLVFKALSNLSLEPPKAGTETPELSWDPENSGPFIVTAGPMVTAALFLERSRTVYTSFLWKFASQVQNSGSQDKWQMARSQQTFSRGRVKATIRCAEDILCYFFRTHDTTHFCYARVTAEPKTSNAWRFIFGCIPDDVNCKGPKQWVGTGVQFSFYRHEKNNPCTQILSLFAPP